MVSAKKGFAIGRLQFVPPGSGDVYYLRMLLNACKGPETYDDIKTIDGIQYKSLKDACYAIGLLDDDQEYIDGIKEASHWGTAPFLRNLFATLLLSNQLGRPEIVWENTWQYLSDDILHRQRLLLRHKDLQLTDEELKNYTLAEIENLLRSNNTSLTRFPELPSPNMSLLSQSQNRLIYDELNYNRDILASEHQVLLSKLNIEQKGIYEKIMKVVAENNGGVFFLYGFGGTGKTFLWRTLSNALRSKGEIVLTVASSGIASLLIPGGRTSHSRFAIPINVDEDSTCNIKQGSQLAQLIIKAKLIIWDEAPMTHKHCFEAVDKTMRDLLRFSTENSLNKPFGGKIVVFGGDFRQILPVVPRGTRPDIIFAAINSSYIWSYCQVLTLTTNMRIQSGTTSSDIEQAKKFSEWVLKIGDELIDGQTDDQANIEIPDEYIIKYSSDPIASLVESTYPSLIDNIYVDGYLQQRAILTPKNDIVQKINEYMLSLIPGEMKTYLSFDSPCPMNGGINVHTPEFLNTIRPSGLPRHELKLKVGVPVMVLRNIDQCAGLCNGTRLLITQLGKHVIEGKIISGNNVGSKVFIPRLNLTPSDTRHYHFDFSVDNFHYHSHLQ